MSREKRAVSGLARFGHAPAALFEPNRHHARQVRAEQQQPEKAAMLAALFGAKAKKNAVSVTGSHARINPGDMPSSQLPSSKRLESQRKRKGGRGVVASGIQVCGVVVVSKRLVRVRCPIRVCLFDVES